MNLKITTDLAKIAVKVDVSVKNNSLSDYNIMCILLDRNNKILFKNCIIDFRNNSLLDGIISVERVSDKSSVFYVNLNKMPNDLNRINFFIVNKIIGKDISCLDKVSVTLLDLHNEINIATMEMPYISRNTKCIHMCIFYRRDDFWDFQEICKRVELNEYGGIKCLMTT